MAGGDEIPRGAICVTSNTAAYQSHVAYLFGQCSVKGRMGAFDDFNLGNIGGCIQMSQCVLLVCIPTVIRLIWLQPVTSLFN